MPNKERPDFENLPVMLPIKTPNPDPNRIVGMPRVKDRAYSELMASFPSPLPAPPMRVTGTVHKDDLWVPAVEIMPGCGGDCEDVDPDDV